jgi:Histidine kinase-, DNA gyrase B-, and HSP90-like ATPase
MPTKYPPDNQALLRGIAAGRVGWLTACCEWIDNAFDQDAMRVAITFGDRTLIVEDDGAGTATPHDLVQIGRHRATERGLGEFGMGGKESLLWAAGEKGAVEITSTHRGHITRALSMNWPAYAEAWELPDAAEWPARLDEIGTRILIPALQVAVPSSKALEALMTAIGYRYSHALRVLNKQITFRLRDRRPQVVSAWEPPPFDHELPIVREAPIRIGPHDRLAVVTAGIVPEGRANPRSGLTYWHSYRVIIDASAHGCGRFNIGRICGFVELRDGWRDALGRNKNEIRKDAQLLFTAVEETIWHVLEAADQIGSTFAHRQLTQQLEALFNAPRPATAKAKRDPGAEHGTVDPQQTPRRHRQARKTQPGERFPRDRGNRAVKVEWQHLGGTKLGDCKPPRHVLLNLDNAFVAQARDTSNLAALQVVIITLLWDSDQQQDDRGDRYLPFPAIDRFSVVAGEFLATNPQLDGHALLDQEAAHPA